MNAYANKNTGKLLAAVLIIAMAIAGASVVFSDSTDAANVSGTMTESAFIETAVESVITLDDDVVITEEGNDGINLANYTVNTQGYSITITSDLIGGKINAVSGGVVLNIGVANGTADITVTDTAIKMSGTTLPTYAFNVINGNNLTLQGVDVSGTDGQKFGLVSYATYYAPGSDVIINSSTIENGVITFKNLENDSTLTVNSSPGFYMNYVDTTTIGSNVKINCDYKGTILGWDKSTMGSTESYGNGFNLNVTDDFDLGDLTKGDGAPANAQFSVTADKGVTITYSGGNGIDITKDNSNRTGIDNNVVALEGDIVIDGEAYLVGPVTIPADKTVIIRNGGSLDLYGSSLTLYGNLIVENRGSVIGTDGSEKIVLMNGGSIQNDGAIGGAVAVSVYAADASGESFATMQNIVGVSFGLIRSGNAEDGYTYTLSVTGDVSRAMGTSSSDAKTLSLNGVSVNGNLTTSKDVTLSGTFYVIRNGNLTTNGSVSDATIGMLYGATVNINGTFADSTINAATEEELTAEEANNNTVSGITSFTSNGNGTATGFTITVDRVQYTAPNGIDIMFNQRAYVSGSVASSGDRQSTANLVISGNAFVPSGETVLIADNADILTNGQVPGLLIVEGTVQNVQNFFENTINFVGATMKSHLQVRRTLSDTYPPLR